MIDLIPAQILGLGVAVLSIIPAFLLLRQYFKTKIRDYFLFFLFFADAFVVLTLDVIAGATRILFLIQLHHISIDFIYVVLVMHASRIIWKKTPKIILGITFVWFFSLMALTLSWQIVNPVHSGDWLGFLNFPVSYSSYAFTIPGVAADVTFGNIIIYGTQFRIFGDLFRIYAVGLLLYAYITAQPLSPTKKILQAKKIWIVVWALLLVHATVLFPPFGETELGTLVGLSLIIAGFLITYISLFIPEAILISRVQVQRIFDLYDKVDKSSDEDEIEKIHIDSLMNYLKSVKTALNDESDDL